MKEAEIAYNEGLNDGQLDWSTTNRWTFSIHMSAYSQGYSEGSRLRAERHKREQLEQTVRDEFARLSRISWDDYMELCAREHAEAQRKEAERAGIDLELY